MTAFTDLLWNPDLPLAWRFYVGAVLIVTVWILASVCTFLLPILMGESIAWCRKHLGSPPTNVVDLAKRRQQLEAAAGRRAS